MNRDDLRRELEQTPVPPAAYSLDGRYKEFALILEQGRGRWTVCYAERGDRVVLKSFATESEACEFMLAEIRRIEVPEYRHQRGHDTC